MGGRGCRLLKTPELGQHSHAKTTKQNEDKSQSTISLRRQDNEGNAKINGCISISCVAIPGHKLEGCCSLEKTSFWLWEQCYAEPIVEMGSRSWSLWGGGLRLGKLSGAHKTPCNPQVNGKTDNDDRKTNIDISALSTWWRWVLTRKVLPSSYRRSKLGSASAAFEEVQLQWRCCWWPRTVCSLQTLC